MQKCVFEEEEKENQRTNSFTCTLQKEKEGKREDKSHTMIFKWF